MWFMGSGSALPEQDTRAGALAAQAHIACDVKPRSGVLKLKKKARRRGDVPSNKRYGNCLLGFHCSQKGRPASRTSIGFPPVADCQQGFLTTGYPQVLVNRLWIKSRHGSHPTIHPLETSFRGTSGPDFSGCGEQSSLFRRS
jgi:hypothetical protein